MLNRLQLVEVASQAEERDLLAELARWPHPAAGRLLPARGAGVAARLEDIGRRCGLEVARSRLGERATWQGARELPPQAGGLPELLVVSAAVDPAIAALGSSLSQLPCTSFDQALSAGELEAKSALVLWAPPREPLAAVVEVLSRLRRARIQVGLLPCFGTPGDWAALAKALTFCVLPGRRVRRLDQGASSSLAQLRAPVDLTVFSGHGGPLDAGLDERTILCSRRSDEPLGRGQAGLLPCYHDGRCIRQIERRSQSELLRVAELDTLGLLAFTCYYVHLGPSPMDQARGLAAQLMAGNLVAALSCVGALWPDPLLTATASALLLAGRTFGEVAQILDHSAHDRLPPSMGLPPDVPAIVAVGNPAARFSAPAVSPFTPAILRDGADVILRAPDAGWPAAAATVEVPLAPDQRDVSGWSMAAGEQLQAEGRVGRADDGRRCLKLVLSAATGAPPTDLRLSPIRDAGAERRAIEEFVAALDFWSLYLDVCLQVREDLGTSTEAIQTAMLALPRTRRYLAGGLVSAGASGRIRRDGAAGLERALASQLAKIQGISRELLRLTLDLVAHEGILDPGTHIPLAEGEAGLTSGPCACAQAELRSRRWRAPGSSALESYCHSCPCGDAGFDSCRPALGWRRAPRAVRRSETLALAVSLTAPPDRFLLATAAASFELWRHERQVAGPMVAVNLHPGTTTELDCDLLVPPDMPLGLHQVALVAIVNGGLVFRRYLVDVQP